MAYLFIIAKTFLGSNFGLAPQFLVLTCNQSEITSQGLSRQTPSSVGPQLALLAIYGCICNVARPLAILLILTSQCHPTLH
jgi:hypothetical protein